MPDDGNSYEMCAIQLMSAGSNMGGAPMADLPVGTAIHVERVVRHTVHSTLTTSLLVALGRVTTDAGETFPFEYVPLGIAAGNEEYFPWRRLSDTEEYWEKHKE
jgi:hypothetical protein